ncbi:protein of unknown function [Rhodovastum atsumiense]|nr:protein of unknown function [Rhodovastum atsumiense]
MVSFIILKMRMGKMFPLKEKLLNIQFIFYMTSGSMNGFAISMQMNF